MNCLAHMVPSSDVVLRGNCLLKPWSRPMAWMWTEVNMLTFVVSAQILFPFFGRDSFGRRVQQSHRGYLDLKQTHTKRNAFKNRPIRHGHGADATSRKNRPNILLLLYWPVMTRVWTQNISRRISVWLEIVTWSKNSLYIVWYRYVHKIFHLFRCCSLFRGQ